MTSTPSTSSPLSSSWAVRSCAGEPFAVVQVKNLQTTIPAALDPWGRANKLQPITVSAEVSFARPFDTAAADDRLGNDTVHYGNLSQAILDSLSSLSVTTAHSTFISLRGVLEKIWVDITGHHLNPSEPSPVFISRQPFLSPVSLARVRFLSITVTLPKASLLGDSVSLTGSATFTPNDETVATEKYGISLAINKLRVPTLIGINPHERLAKQFVITTVTIDKFVQRDNEDIYTEVEALVVNTLESSSFETLEALGAHLADCILTKYRSDEDACQWLVHIQMEKPTATPFADCPIVEIRAGCAFPPVARPSVAALESP